MDFRSELRRLRESVRANFAELDRAIGKQNYVARVERGELVVPDRETAEKLGSELQRRGARTSASALWTLAAAEHASEIDPDVVTYVEEQLVRARAGSSGRLSPFEANLLGRIGEFEA